MSSVRKVFLLFFLVLELSGLSQAHAQVGCVPNPNDTAPMQNLYVNGCKFDATSINNLVLAVAPLPSMFGAVAGGVTDAATALQACLNNLSGQCVMPAGIYRSSTTLNVPDGMNWVCQSSQPLSPPPSPGCEVIFDLAVTPEVTVGNNDLKPNVIKGIVLTRAAGTVPASSHCMDVNGGDNVTVEDVMCHRSAQGFVLNASGINGIYFHGHRLYTCGITDADVVISGWPGAFFYESIFGCDIGDVAHNAFVRINGNWDNTIGTIHFVDTQLNLGSSVTVTCAVNFQSFTGSTNVVWDFEYIGGHIETAQNAFCSDSTVKGIRNVAIQGVWAGGGWGGNNHFFANTSSSYAAGLNPATTIQYWSVNGLSLTGWADLTLAPTAQIDSLNISGSSLPVPISLTGTSHSTATLAGNTFNGITVAGHWDSAYFSGSNLGGSVTNTVTAGSSVEFDIPGLNQASQTDCHVGFGLQFGGGTTGLTYASTPSCMYQLQGNLATVSFIISLSAKGSSTGIATIVGLPFTAGAVSGPGSAALYSSGMASLTGPVVAQAAPSTKTINLYHSGASGVVALTDANFTNSSVVEGSLTYLVATSP